MATSAQQLPIDASATGLETKLKSTQITAAPKKRSIGLIDLPAAVRNNIYKYALDTELVNVGKPNVSYTHSLRDGSLNFKASRSPFPVSTALFLVNKEVSAEAQRYFYSKNLFVRFEIYTADTRHAKTMLEESGLLFSTAEPELLERAAQHALEVVLVEKNSSQRRATVMFPAQYLPRLINFLDQASRATSTWAPAHTLFLNVMNTYGFPVSRVQGDLLELFRLLFNFGGVTVDSKNVLPQYATGLQRDMTSAKFDPDTWLASVSELTDFADEARNKEDYTSATEHAQAAIIAMTYGYLTHPEALHSAPEDFSKRIQHLRWRTELGLGITLSLQHQPLTSTTKNWLDTPSPSTAAAATALLLAESSISRALSLSTDSPSPTANPWFLSLPVELIPPNKPTFFTDAERAQTWYVLGTVHTALGEYLFAAGDLERALGMWGDEGREKVEKAFEKAREGIDGDRENMWVGRVRPGTGLKRAAALAKGMGE